MAPPLAIHDPELGALVKQCPDTRQTSTLSSTLTTSSTHVPAVDDNQYIPNLAQAQQGPGQFGDTDGSGSLFSMYIDKVQEGDEKRTDDWQRDASGVLAFSGRFSIAVAVLLAMTIQDIRPNSQDASAYYLSNILQQLAQSNGTHIPIPSTLRNPASPFTPPTWAIWVNGLWFMSLLTSLTCALLAMFLQQWTRRYLRVAYPQYSPHRRARIRAFYANGVEELRLPWLVDVLPALLHISFSLFLAGLSVFLFNINNSIFKSVVTWIGLCVILYAYLTISPILHKNSPYSSPLSGLVSFCLTGIRSGFFQAIERWPALVYRFPVPIQFRNRGARVHLGDFSPMIRTTAEQFALQLSPEIDYDSLTWMFRSLDEDKDLEQFFEGIPGLCESKAMPNALYFIKRNEKMLSSALIELINRTLSSNLVSDEVKLRRIIICTKTVDATSLLGPWWLLRRVLLGDWQKFLECTEFGLFVQNWKSIGHPVTHFYTQCVAAITISSVHGPDDRWFQLASGALGETKDLFRDYIKHTDSIILANVIHIVRRTIQAYSGAAERHRSDILGASSKALESLRQLDFSHTSPGLQHEFCNVWNQLVDLVQNGRRPDVVEASQMVLENIRELYITLHEDTNSFSTAISSATDDGDSTLDDSKSYRKCSIPGHRPSQPVPGLRIEEPAPEAITNVPLEPTIVPGTIPASRPQLMLPPPSFPIPLPLPRATSPVSSSPQPTHLGACHVHPPTTFVPAIPPSPVPISHSPSSLNGNPLPQLFNQRGAE